MEEYKGLRIYRDGRVERKWMRGGRWKEVENVGNNNDGYNQVNADGKTWKRHRLIVAAFNPEFDINNTAHQIDHIDGNKLNNAFENLRVVSSQGNQFNKHIAKGYTRDKGKWRARIMINSKNKNLGSYDTEEAARAAYLAAKAKYHVIQTIC